MNKRRLRWLDDFLWWRECGTEIIGAIVIVSVLWFLWNSFDFHALYESALVSFGAVIIFAGLVGERLARTPEDG